MQGVSWLVFLEISLLQGGFLQFFFLYLTCFHSVTSPLHLSIYLHFYPLAFSLMFLAHFVLIWRRRVCVIPNEEQKRGL